MTEKRDY